MPELKLHKSHNGVMEDYDTGEFYAEYLAEDSHGDFFKLTLTAEFDALYTIETHFLRPTLEPFIIEVDDDT